MSYEKREDLQQRVIELLEINGLIQREGEALPNTPESVQAPYLKPS